MTDIAKALPDIGTVLAPILSKVPRERQPLLIALAERQAAARYRVWAGQVADATRRAELLACADREEEIARRVEALYPDAPAVQSEIVAANPGLDEIGSALFAGRSLEEQFTIQARGERLGAATWRSFAKHAATAEARATFLACAVLEEESAAVLEALVA
jgi:hypothetical protein